VNSTQLTAKTGALFKRLKRFGYLDHLISITDLVSNSDNGLFKQVSLPQCYCLYHLFPLFVVLITYVTGAIDTSCQITPVNYIAFLFGSCLGSFHLAFSISWALLCYVFVYSVYHVLSYSVYWFILCYYWVYVCHAAITFTYLLTLKCFNSFTSKTSKLLSVCVYLFVTTTTIAFCTSHVDVLDATRNFDLLMNATLSLSTWPLSALHYSISEHMTMYAIFSVNLICSRALACYCYFSA